MFNFGEHLKELRKNRNITQKQLANAIGASERGIQNYELNQRKPTYDALLSLANYFNVSLDYLVGRSNNMNGVTPSHPSSLLCQDDLELLELFHQLDGQSRGQLQARAKYLLEQQQGHPAEPETIPFYAKEKEAK